MLGLAVISSVLLQPASGISTEAGAPRLVPGMTVSRDLSGRDRHEYDVPLTRGSAFYTVVEQNGVDLSLELFDPSGKELVRVDTGRGAYGPERLWAVAGSSGNHRLLIRALDEEASGHYVIQVVELRPPGPQERARAAAQGVHMRSRNWEERDTEAARSASRAGLVRALSLWHDIGDAEQEALVWLDLARFRVASGDSRRALEAADRALERANAAGDRQLEAKILGQKALALEYLGDPQRGIDVLSRSLELARSAGDRQQEASALHLQAWGNWSIGRYQEALDLDARSLAIGRAIGDREAKAWALNGLGVTYWALGDPEKSLGVFEEALGLWRSLGDRRGEAFTLQNLGFSYWSLGATRRALDAYEQVLPVARALGDRRSEALALNNTGLALDSLGEFAAAAETLRRALALWASLGDSHGSAISWHNLGTAEEGLGRADEAAAAWRKAVAAARSARDRRSESLALAAMARLDVSRGRLDEARVSIEESLAIVESLRGQIAAPALRSSFLSSQQDDYGIAMDVLLALEAREPGRGHAGEAFGMSERSRARALLDGIAEARLDLAQDLPEDLRRREAEVGARIKALQVEALAAGPEKADAERRLDLAEDEWEALVAEMRRRTPRYASLRYPLPMSAEAARKALGPATAIVSFAVNSERILAFVLTPSGLSARRLSVPPADLTERVEDFVGLIARAEEDRWRRLGGRLYGDLVEPWIGDLPSGTRSLVIVPDGVLASLPFEVLAPAALAGRRLVERFDVSYAPSATALAELQAIPPSANEPADILVVADPLVANGGPRSAALAAEGAFDLAPLPRAAVEARTIARFGGARTEVLTGRLASERRIREVGLDRFRVMHFATHGLLDPRHPARSGLLLASEQGSNGLLSAREIYRLKLRTDLVVLAACQTARGRILAGEGVQSLARAFFHAGADAVVATLWDVNDRRSERLMTGFYARLALGDSRSAALSNAKRELLQAEPDLAPRFWAAFIVIGNGRDGVRLARPSWWRALLAR